MPSEGGSRGDISLTPFLSVGIGWSVGVGERGGDAFRRTLFPLSKVSFGVCSGGGRYFHYRRSALVCVVVADVISIIEGQLWCV